MSTNKKLSPIEQYYESIIEKANQLLQDKKYDEALIILEDELEAPYIPIEQQDKIEDLARFILAEKEYFKGINKYEKLDRKSLLESSFKSDKKNHMESLDKYAFALFFERFGNEILEDELEYIQYYLSSRKMKLEDKVQLFVFLKGIKNNNIVKFFNNYLKQEFELNLLETKVWNQIELYKEVEKIIYDLTMKEPSLQKYCEMILYMIYVANFPKVPEFEINQLAYGIFNYMMFALNGEKSKENLEVFSYVENIIKELDEQKS